MNLITRDYQGVPVVFNDAGWINATDYAVKHGKRVDHWLANQDTKDYITTLCEITDTRKVGYVKTSKATIANGGGTWLHPKMAVAFARWIDPRFAIWCDTQIDNLICRKDNWRVSRHASASGYKLASDILKMVRDESGKETKSYHYSNEARLINWAMTGKFDGIDRDTLSADDLDMLAYLQERNAVLIGRGLDYDKRKPMIQQYAMDRRLELHFAGSRLLVEKLDS